MLEEDDLRCSGALYITKLNCDQIENKLDMVWKQIGIECNK